MSNLVDIQAQIDKLQKQAQQIKSKEFGKTVQDIKQKMLAFGITAKDLQTAKPPKAVKTTRANIAKNTSKPSGAKVAAKYADGTGQTWSGRGLMPRWLSALVAQGRAKDEFLVK